MDILTDEQKADMVNKTFLLDSTRARVRMIQYMDEYNQSVEENREMINGLLDLCESGVLPQIFSSAPLGEYVMFDEIEEGDVETELRFYKTVSALHLELASGTVEAWNRELGNRNKFTTYPEIPDIRLRLYCALLVTELLDMKDWGVFSLPVPESDKSLPQFIELNISDLYLKFANEPLSLQQLCRMSVRKNVPAGVSLSDHIEALTLPASIKKYLFG